MAPRVRSGWSRRGGRRRRTRGSGLLSELQLSDVVEHPVGLRGVRGKKRQSFAPFEESLDVIATFFELRGAMGDDGEFFGIDEGVALSADKVAGM